ncbi:hypothetical protein IAD21_00717 [Abditibacteriota bacterium]|nr:hypothetical protein IAD21_00717 [Abditibacteriota bacterium]
MERSQGGDLSPPNVEDWTRKLKRVWEPSAILEVRPRTDGGFLFIAGLSSGVVLHLGVRAEGVDMCAIWKGKNFVLWDSLIGFCSTLSPLPVSPEQTALETQMRPLVRRNCFLMGCDIEATDGEMREWNTWLVGRPNSDAEPPIST